MWRRLADRIVPASVFADEPPRPWWKVLLGWLWGR